MIEKRKDDSNSKAEYKISRSFEIKKTSDGSEIVKSDFDLFFDDDQGDDVVSDEFASSKIESDIFPEVLSEYVWFQGESLDKLIDLDQSSSFKKVIDSISYLDIYDTINEVLKITETKLDRALRKKLKASKTNEKALNDAQFYIESSKRKLESNKAKVIKNVEDIDKYRVERTELEEKLAARDDTEQLIITL